MIEMFNPNGEIHKIDGEVFNGVYSGQSEPYTASFGVERESYTDTNVAYKLIIDPAKPDEPGNRVAVTVTNNIFTGNSGGRPYENNLQKYEKGWNYTMKNELVDEFSKEVICNRIWDTNVYTHYKYMPKTIGGWYAANAFYGVRTNNGDEIHIGNFNARSAFGDIQFYEYRYSNLNIILI